MGEGSSHNQGAQAKSLESEARQVASEAATTVDIQAASSQLENQPSPDDFDAFYLRQVTSAFADDIEKLRKAPDFKDGAVERLVQSLKQPAANFTQEEKKQVMRDRSRSTQ